MKDKNWLNVITNTIMNRNSERDNKFFKFPNMELEQLAELYSESLDDLIIRERKLNHNYVGGEFIIKYLNDKLFLTSYEMYFQDENKEWLKKSGESKPQELINLTEKAIKILKTDKKVIFEINPPEEK